MKQTKENEYLLSVFLYANNEVESLKQIIIQIHEGLQVDYELIVYLKNENCPSFSALKELMAQHPDWDIGYCFQKEPYIVATLYEVAKISKGSHILVWMADNEITTDSLFQMAKLSRTYPKAIVCASKFHKDSVLHDYGRIKKIVRKSLDLLINILYHKRGRDFYSVNKILPLEYFDEMYFSSPEHLLFEYTLVALKLGKEYLEVPVVFHKRTEGESSFNLMFNVRIGFSYLGSIIRVFFTPKHILCTKRKLTL